MALIGIAPRTAEAQFVDCTSLTASQSPAANRLLLQTCLNDPTVPQVMVKNTGGIFTVDTMITIPDGKQLLGDLTGGPGNTPTWPTIQAVTVNGNEFFSSNTLIEIHNTARLGFLQVDGNTILYPSHSSVVRIAGAGSQIDNNHIRNSQPDHGAGIYIMCNVPLGQVRVCDGSNGLNPVRQNQILNNQIYQNFSGIIFEVGLTSAEVNTAEGNTLRNNTCDPITLAGYGRAINNTIYNNGYNCWGNPPGGAIYSKGNTAGGVITGNSISNSCGNNIDLDNSRGFTITRNTLRDPGFQGPFEPNGATYPACKGAVSLLMVDVSDSQVISNTIRNDNRPWNKMQNIPQWAPLVPEGGKRCGL